MKKIGYVYLTTNLVNGKMYVGQHLATEFDTKYKGSGTALKYAFEKYGWDNFKCEIICWCSTQTQLNEAEDNYIKLLNTMSPNGYNLRGGGSKGRYSKEVCKNMSEALKKRYENPEARKKISEALKGRVSPNKGKRASEETRKKQSEAQKKRFENEENRKKMSENKKKYYANEENCKKLSEAQLNHPKKSKKILQFTKNGEFVKEWVSAREIERVLGFANQHISNCCNGKAYYKYAYGFIWKFADNNLQETSSQTPQ